MKLFFNHFPSVPGVMGPSRLLAFSYCALLMLPAVIMRHHSNLGGCSEMRSPP